MLHLIYTRNNYDMDSVGGHFESHITLIRNVPYSHLSRLLINKNDPELLKECDTKYILIHAADCIISNKDIGILLDTHQRYKGCFSTSPTFYNENGKKTTKCPQFEKKYQTF